MSTRHLLVAVALVVPLLAACGGGSDAAGDDAPGPGGKPGGPTVVLKDIQFKPGTIEIAAGATVTWKFEDKNIPHNVVAANKDFASDTKDSGMFRHTFEKAGTFAYICTIHPAMKGTVEVT